MESRLWIDVCVWLIFKKSKLQLQTEMNEILVCRKVCSIFESRLRSHFWNCDLASQLLLELLFISILTEWPDKENIVIELYEIYNYIQARNISTLYLENCMWWLCSYMLVHFLGKKPHVCKLLGIHGFRRNASCLVSVKKTTVPPGTAHVLFLYIGRNYDPSSSHVNALVL